MIAHAAPTVVRYGHGEVWLTGWGAFLAVALVLMICLTIVFMSDD